MSARHVNVLRYDNKIVNEGGNKVATLRNLTGVLKVVILALFERGILHLFEGT